ncbi:TPA: hypothetical protein QDB40_001522 [Burkholderia vietnamiensis]|uniref:hypothetical protein n=1 Tax=Burkholderia vietnamiensis TaxID=60552 RepID=UPI001594699F|nr:hypothetical protein [Burkholderia vietnamiensis]HDR9099242.1 hypothetical protein [Burkholderia vietnamiensis]HDR9167567.1 hypothetical protein [Burkholderia vietnamiensis]HDR9280564.1 hypothetical protein [Burkholderia vietnamiensis]
MHDAIEAARKSTLKRTSISKNNRKFLPRNSRINSAAFPESALPRGISWNFTDRPGALREAAASHIGEIFFYFFIYI